MAIQLGYDLLNNMFTNTIFFNVDWILSLVATLLTLLIITRDYNKWKELAFPVMIGWHIAGVSPFILIYLISAILFVVETLSLQVLGSLLSTIRRTSKDYTEKFNKLSDIEVITKKEERRLDKFEIRKKLKEERDKMNLAEIMEKARGKR